MHQCFTQCTSENINEYDVCIVGAGVAGIISANSLLKLQPALRILIIESGNYAGDGRHDKELRKKNFTNPFIKKGSRKFVVGGSSSIWGGLNATLRREELDRSWLVSNKKWQIPFDELKKYYTISQIEFGFNGVLNSKDSESTIGSINERVFEAKVEPINYKSYLDEKIDIIYNAHVTDINKKVDFTIKNIEISSLLSADKKNVQAKTYILALGTLETCKLLLNSHAKNSILGNEAHNLGRFFMNHPKGQGGTVTFTNKDIDLNRFIGSIENNRISFTGISLPQKLKNERFLLPYLRLEPQMPWANDVLIFRLIEVVKRSKKLVNFFFNYSKKKDIQLVDFSETGDNEIKDLKHYNLYRSFLNIISYTFFRLLNRRPSTNDFIIRNYLEMEPRYENKIYLTDRKDAFGNNEIDVDYQIGVLDRESLFHLHRHFKKELEQRYLGSLTPIVDSDFDNFTDASHHIGGAIMGENPEGSIVDNTHKVHSLTNLYILGSSVFPTSGSCNPTWTIAAMSVRFADIHVRNTDYMKDRFA